jgi:tetratricopeptide (TPR) repeat protein
MCLCDLFAARYTHLLRLIESTRDFEDQQQLDTADGIKATLLSNLALVAFQQEEYARSIEWCDKALNMDPENAKVRTCVIRS